MHSIAGHVSVSKLLLMEGRVCAVYCDQPYVKHAAGVAPAHLAFVLTSSAFLPGATNNEVKSLAVIRPPNRSLII